MKSLVAKMVELERHPSGPRLRIAGQRIHHGASSLVVVAVLLLFRRTRIFAPLFLVFTYHDRHDWRFWFAPGDPAAARKGLLKTKSLPS